jgi:hypothetical protein
MPEETVPDIRFSSGRHGYRPILERHVSQVRGHCNGRGSSGGWPRLPGKVEAVVVEAQA